MGAKKGIKNRGLSLEQVLHPCPYQPGSEEKIQWMAARLSFNLPLHIQGDFSIPIHPHDKNRNIRSAINNREIIPDPDEDEEEEEEDLDDI